MFGSWPNVHRWALPSTDRPLPVVRPGHGAPAKGGSGGPDPARRPGFRGLRTACGWLARALSATENRVPPVDHSV